MSSAVHPEDRAGSEVQAQEEVLRSAGHPGDTKHAGKWPSVTGTCSRCLRWQTQEVEMQENTSQHVWHPRCQGCVALLGSRIESAVLTEVGVVGFAFLPLRNGGTMRGL